MSSVFNNPFDAAFYDANNMAAYDPAKFSTKKRGMLQQAIIHDPELDVTSRRLISFVLSYSNNTTGRTFPFKERELIPGLAKFLKVSKHQVRFILRKPAVELWMLRSGHEFWFNWDRAADFDKWFRASKAQLKAEVEAEAAHIRSGRKPKATEIVMPTPPEDEPKTLQDLQGERASASAHATVQVRLGDAIAHLAPNILKAVPADQRQPKETDMSEHRKPSHKQSSTAKPTEEEIRRTVALTRWHDRDFAVHEPTEEELRRVRRNLEAFNGLFTE